MGTPIIAGRTRPQAASVPRVAVLFHRFGPYHVSRMDRAAGVVDLHGVELSGTDRVYAWSATSGEGRFPRVVVSQDLDSESGYEVVKKTTAVLSSLSPDVVAVPGWSHRGALAALLWCMRTGTPAVLMSDSTELDMRRRPWREAIKRRIVALFESALVAGAPQRDYLVDLGMAATRIRTGLDVVDNSHFERGADRVRRAAVGPVAPGEAGLHFLAVCRFVPEKNLLWLIDAFDRYRSFAGGNAWDLVLAGDGPLRSEIERRIRAKGLERRVRLVGFRQYGELPALYGRAGALVHPSTREPWGLVVNEAMAAGLPVLVSDRCGCAQDLVEPGRNGYRFDPADAEGLSCLLQSLSSGRVDLEKMGRSSRSIIAQWSLERFASGLRQAALLALGHRAHRAPVDRYLVRALIERHEAPPSTA